MSDPIWVYDEGEWTRTRVVEVFQAADGLFYWRRSRIKGGVAGKVVAVSGGYNEEHWAYQSAVKENYPLPVASSLDPVPGVDPGDAPNDPDVPPGPEPGTPPGDPADAPADAPEPKEKKKQVSGK